MTEPRECLFGCVDRDERPLLAEPGLLVCQRCERGIAHLVDELARLYATIRDPEELIPHGDGSRGNAGYGSRSPAVDTLLAHADPRTRPSEDMPYPALATVEQWARSIREELSLDTPPEKMRDTVPAGRVTMARELATIRFHWHWLLGQDWLPAFVDELRDVVHHLRAGTRELAPAIRLGACPVVVEQHADPDDPDEILIAFTCGAALHVRLGDQSICCRRCGTVWERDRWHLLGDPWADYATLAEDLGVAVGTLRRWCHEDKWETRGGRRRLVKREDAIRSYYRRRTSR